MELAANTNLKETFTMLVSMIERREKLDDVALRRLLRGVSRLPDESIKLMFSGFAYGAARNHMMALSHLKESAAYHNEMVIKNYLSYLGNTGEYRLYTDETIRLAREVSSLRLAVQARNAAFNDGNGELALFFGRRAMSMIGDDDERDTMEKDILSRKQVLDNFIETTKLTTAEISRLTISVSEVAKKHSVLVVMQDFYTGSDGEAAIICDVICDDDNVISDMDIDVATEIATNDVFAGKNITAWFRGRSSEGRQFTL